jgi:hypothetical protein
MHDTSSVEFFAGQRADLRLKQLIRIMKHPSSYSQFYLIPLLNLQSCRSLAFAKTTSNAIKDPIRNHMMVKVFSILIVRLATQNTFASSPPLPQHGQRPLSHCKSPVASNQHATK